MSRHHSRSFYASVAVVLLNTVLCIAAAEFLAGLYMKSVRSGRPLYMLTYTDDTLRALYETDDPAKYREVVSESWRMGETVYSPLAEFRMQPYAGQHFTITEDGYRPNRLSPQDLSRPGPKVFVFGGSTTMGSGVADQDTIPAAVERSLAAAGRADVQVFNFGVVSYYSTQERIALERMLTAGGKPDVAVFVDGLNDFYYCTIPDQTSWNNRLVETTRARARMPLALELSHRSNIVQLARHLGGDKSVVVREWGSFCNSDTDVEKVARRLDTNRRMIAAIGKSMGIKTVFVQQPVPTFHYDNSKRPFPVTEEMLGYHANSARGYRLMDQMRQAGTLFSDDLLWLAEAEPKGNAYVDTVHYSPGFNELIGARIGAAILERGLLAP